MKVKLFQRITSIDKLLDCGEIELPQSDKFNEENPPLWIDLRTDQGLLVRYNRVDTLVGYFYLKEYNTL